MPSGPGPGICRSPHPGTQGAVCLFTTKFQPTACDGNPRGNECREFSRSLLDLHFLTDAGGRTCGSGGHEGTGPWPPGWALPPPPPVGRWPEIRTPAVAATRGFRRRAAQDVSSLGPYLVKVFRDSVIRLRGGGGPGSLPGDRAAAAAFLKSASRPPTPGFPPSQGTPRLAEPGVRSTSIPGPLRGRAETRPALWERLVAQGAARIMSLFPSTPLLTRSPYGAASGLSVPDIEALGSFLPWVTGKQEDGFSRLEEPVPAQLLTLSTLHDSSTPCFPLSETTGLQPLNSPLPGSGKNLQPADN
nr:uncharacterized protein LOC107402187 [Peromyscus maniculatus bairdii]